MVTMVDPVLTMNIDPPTTYSFSSSSSFPTASLVSPTSQSYSSFSSGPSPLPIKEEIFSTESSSNSGFDGGGGHDEDQEHLMLRTDPSQLLLLLKMESTTSPSPSPSPSPSSAAAPSTASQDLADDGNGNGTYDHTRTTTINGSRQQNPDHHHHYRDGHKEEKEEENVQQVEETDDVDSAGEELSSSTRQNDRDHHEQEHEHEHEHDSSVCSSPTCTPSRRATKHTSLQRMTQSRLKSPTRNSVVPTPSPSSEKEPASIPIFPRHRRPVSPYRQQQQMLLLTHPLMPYVLRAVDDVRNDRVLSQYVPSTNDWKRELRLMHEYKQQQQQPHQTTNIYLNNNNNNDNNNNNVSTPAAVAEILGPDPDLNTATQFLLAYLRLLEMSIREAWSIDTKVLAFGYSMLAQVRQLEAGWRTEQAEKERGEKKAEATAMAAKKETRTPPRCRSHLPSRDELIRTSKSKRIPSKPTGSHNPTHDRAACVNAPTVKSNRKKTKSRSKRSCSDDSDDNDNDDARDEEHGDEAHDDEDEDEKTEQNLKLEAEVLEKDNGDKNVVASETSSPSRANHRSSISSSRRQSINAATTTTTTTAAAATSSPSKSAKPNDNGDPRRVTSRRSERPGVCQDPTVNTERKKSPMRPTNEHTNHGSRLSSNVHSTKTAATRTNEQLEHDSSDLTRAAAAAPPSTPAPSAFSPPSTTTGIVRGGAVYTSTAGAGGSSRQSFPIPSSYHGGSMQTPSSFVFPWTPPSSSSHGQHHVATLDSPLPSVTDPTAPIYQCAGTGHHSNPYNFAPNLDWLSSPSSSPLSVCSNQPPPPPTSWFLPSLLSLPLLPPLSSFPTELEALSSVDLQQQIERLQQQVLQQQQSHHPLPCNTGGMASVGNVCSLSPRVPLPLAYQFYSPAPPTTPAATTTTTLATATANHNPVSTPTAGCAGSPNRTSGGTGGANGDAPQPIIVGDSGLCIRQTAS